MNHVLGCKSRYRPLVVVCLYPLGACSSDVGSSSTDESPTLAEWDETTDSSTGDDMASGSSSGSDSNPTEPNDEEESETGDESEGESSTGEEGDVLPCYQDPQWTCVPVDGTSPYGTKTFEVPAAQNWVNTGLYLREGEQATIEESGDWYVSPKVGDTIDHGPCLIGDLVARIGLYYKDEALTCVSGNTTFTADKDGILFLGGLSGNDLGEGYEARVNATGAKTVTVEGEGSTVPTLPIGQTQSFAIGDVVSQWIEVAGKHVILTLPVKTAHQDQGQIDSALKRLDDIYDLHTELRGGKTPYHGQRIRFFPDGTNPGWMLAGNPVRMEHDLVDATYSGRITKAGAPPEDAQVWGFAHEMGHDFTFVNKAWNYQDNSLESWPNLFSVYSLEKLGIPVNDNVHDCPGASGSYDTWDAWGGLCFLMQFRYTYGWDFYKDFFSALNQLDPSEVPGSLPRWHFVHNLFESTSGENVTPVFEAWDVPHP